MPSTQRDLAIAADGSFVETTSESAARALASFYNAEERLRRSTASAAASTSAETLDEVERCQFVITERKEDNGRTVYRIKPRSRPASPVKNSEPTFTFKESPPSPVQTRRKPAESATALRRELRMSRSIPGFRSRNAVKSIMPDAQGFYRPPPSSPQAGLAPGLPSSAPQLAPSPRGRLRAASSPSTGTPLSLRRSRTLLRTARDGDVLGRLLGWSSTPSSEVSSSPTPASLADVPDEETTLSLPPIFRDIPSDLLEELSPSPRTPTMPSPIAIQTNADDKTPSPPTSRSTPKRPTPPTPLTRTLSAGNIHGSPFGDGVRGMSELSRSLQHRRRSDGIEPVPLLAPEQRTVHAVASNESVRTAKDGETAHRAKRTRYEDPTVFDVFQALDAQTVRPSSTTPHDSLDSGFAHHGRNQSSVSLASNASMSSRATAHQITVCSAPGDDPRFLIWGERKVSAGQDKRASGVSESLSSPASGSRRWSVKDRKASMSNGTDLARSDTSSPVLAGSPTTTSSTTTQRVLMAATIERWVAELTSKIDEELLTDFFLTYRTFLSTHDLCRCLITRFHWALAPAHRPEDEAGKRIVRVRTFVVIRHWLLNYFVEDFVNDRELRTILTSWLNSVAKDGRLKDNPKDQQLIKSLKKVVRRLKEAYTSVGFPLTSPSVGSEIGNLSRTSLSLEPEPTGRAPIRLSAVPETIHESPLPPNNLAPSLAPATVLNDDVDLDIDIVISAPVDGAIGEGPPNRGGATYLLPASPPRLRRQDSAAALHFAASPQSSPKGHVRARGGLGSGASNLSTGSPGGSFALPSSHGLVSKTVNTTLGQFGRFKRMLGSRTGGASTAPTQVEDIELEQNETGDLLYVRGDLDTYLRFFDLSDRVDQRKTGVSSDGTVSTSPTSSSGIETPGGPDSDTARDEHIVIANGDEDGLGISYTDAAAASPEEAHELHHSTSSQTIKSEATLPLPPPSSLSRAPRPSSSASELSCRPSFGAPRFRPLFASSFVTQNGSLELSDDSDEDDDVPPAHAIRRLPNARNLKQTVGMRGLQSAFRKSVETISSIGTTRTPSIWQNHPFRRSASPSASDVSDDGSSTSPAPGVATIPNFVVDGLDSDDEEPGDVEAALRRLEGHIDQSKQREKAQRVEAQLSKSAAVAASRQGRIPRSTAESESEGEDDVDERSISQSESGTDASSVLSGAQLDSSLDASMETSDASASFSVSTTSSTAPTQSSTEALPSTSSYLAPPASISSDQQSLGVLPTVSARSSTQSIARKPSIRRFFTLPSSRPGSTTVLAAQRLKIPAPLPLLHRCFLLQFKTEHVAQQFCLIERDLLLNITWHELIEGSWRARAADEVLDWEAFLKHRARQLVEARSKGDKPMLREVQAAIARFNLVANWCTSEILLTTQLEERSALVCKFIRLAFKCYRQSNFATLTEIVHGLQSPHVQRLHRTWARVGLWEMRVFEDLKAFTAHLDNFGSLRRAMQTLADEWGPPGQGSTSSQRFTRTSLNKGKTALHGTIPFLGLFLRDLAVTNELPTYLDPTAPSTPAAKGGEDTVTNEDAFTGLHALPVDVPLRPLVNVHKHRTLAAVVQKVLVFQEMAGLYTYEADPTLFRKCLAIRCLPIESMRNCSLRCEP